MSSGFIRQGEENDLKRSNEPPKSLYDTLQDNYAKKQELLQEANSLKNQIHRLDDDDIEFLQGLRQQAQEAEAKIQQQVAQEMGKFKQAIGKLPQDQENILQEESLRLEQIKGGLKKRKARDNGIQVLTKRSTSQMDKPREVASASKLDSKQADGSQKNNKPSLVSDYDSDE